MKTQSLQFAHLTEVLKPVLGDGELTPERAQSLIQTLAAWFQCQWGTYWKVDARGPALHAFSTWHDSSVQAQKLIADTKVRTLSLSEGTAGHVWRSGIPVVTADLVRDMCLPRSLDARDAGLIGGIWFPIRHERVTLAVVELLGRHYWNPDERLIEQLSLLGESLGQTLGV